MNDATQAYIHAHLADDVASLALRSVPVEVDLPLALQQIAAYQMLSEKVPTWAACPALLLPPRLAMEQCSSELTARYKASLVAGGTMTDLTGGLGIDSYFLAQRFAQATYVERQTALCEAARHNFTQLGAAISVVEAEAEHYLQTMASVDFIYLDPARRDGAGRKTVALADCSPDVAALQQTLLAKADTVMVKLSPMLDIALALRSVQQVAEVHVVAVDNECKELLLLMKRDFTGQTTMVVTALTSRGEQQTLRMPMDEEADAQPPYAAQIGAFLYEPNVAVLKAGLFKSIATHYDVEKLAVSSHLYTSDTLCSEFLGRQFAVQAVIPFSKKAMASLAKSYPKANLTVRNFPLTVAELRQRSKIADGGNTYLFATTLHNEQRVIVVCEKVL